MSSQIFVKVMWSQFHQNWPGIVEMRGCDRQTHTQRHTQTHIRTHRQGLPWVNIFSPKMTEYKKQERYGAKSTFSHLLIIIVKWASYFSMKYVSNAQNTFVFYLGGLNLNISAVSLSTHTPLPVFAAILDFFKKTVILSIF